MALYESHEALRQHFRENMNRVILTAAYTQAITATFARRMARRLVRREYHAANATFTLFRLFKDGTRKEVFRRMTRKEGIDLLQIAYEQYRDQRFILVNERWPEEYEIF